MCVALELYTLTYVLNIDTGFRSSLIPQGQDLLTSTAPPDGGREHPRRRHSGVSRARPP